MPAQFFHLPSRGILYDPDELSADGASLLFAQELDASVTMPGAAGREGVRLIQRGERTWVWRHSRRGGWIGRRVRDSYLWLGAERTRAWREWRLLQHLRGLGLPVPKPVAAAYERRGAVYRCDLVTELLPGTVTLARRLQQGPLEPAAWARIGHCIQQFHAHGVQHADLNAHNILLGADDAVFLIDFDRGRLRRPGVWTEGNWQRLRRSLEKVTRDLPADRFGDAQWGALRPG